MDRFREITQRFSAQTDEFTQWIAGPVSENADTTHIALKQVSNLYSLALELPLPDEIEARDKHAIQTVTLEEWQLMLKKCASLVEIDYYGTVFDPLIFPPEESMQGSVHDDLADIYRDVENGRRYREAGLLDQALWEWSFNFRFHWGNHAVSAIKALHQHAISPSG